MPRNKRDKSNANQSKESSVKLHLPHFIKETDTIRRQIHDIAQILFQKTTEPPSPKISVEFDNYTEIHKLVQQLITLEKDCEKLVSNRNDPKVQERFITWLTDNGAEFENVTIAEFENYELGLQAGKNIGKGDLICAIPRSLMLSHDKIQYSGKFYKFQQVDPMLSEMNNVALAMFLLFEKFKKKSFWKPFIDMLPATYSTIHYFDVEDVEKLSGTRVFKSAISAYKCLVRQYCYFIGRIWHLDHPATELFRQYFTFEEYRWAVSTVMTRENLIPNLDEKKDGVLALIPFWDMANHCQGFMSTGYNVKENRSECSSMQEFKAGEQIFIYYGNRTTLDFFLHNGFVYEENPLDAYPLTLGISSSDALKNKRLDLLDKLGIGPNDTFYLDNSSDPFDNRLLAFCRVFVMNEEQLDLWLNEDTNADILLSPDNMEKALDEKALSFLRMRLKLLSMTFKTTDEEDNRLLQNPDVSTYSKLCIRMRICDKKLLAKFLIYIDDKLKFVKSI